jgi:hypothetical protein
MSLEMGSSEQGNGHSLSVSITIGFMTPSMHPPLPRNVLRRSKAQRTRERRALYIVALKLKYQASPSRLTANVKTFTTVRRCR